MDERGCGLGWGGSKSCREWGGCGWKSEQAERSLLLVLSEGIWMTVAKDLISDRGERQLNCDGPAA